MAARAPSKPASHSTRFGKPNRPVWPLQCQPEGELHSSRPGDGRRSACIPKDAALRRLWPQPNRCCLSGGPQPAARDRTEQAPTSLHNPLRVRQRTQGPLMNAATSDKHTNLTPVEPGTPGSYPPPEEASFFRSGQRPVQLRRAQGPKALKAGPGRRRPSERSARCWAVRPSCDGKPPREELPALRSRRAEARSVRKPGDAWTVRRLPA